MSEEESGISQNSQGGNDDDLFEPKSKPKIIRILTVLAYTLSVSMAAILLSIYYVFMWDGHPTLAHKSPSKAEYSVQPLVMSKSIHKYENMFNSTQNIGLINLIETANDNNTQYTRDMIPNEFNKVNKNNNVLNIFQSTSNKTQQEYSKKATNEDIQNFKIINSAFNELKGNINLKNNAGMKYIKIRSDLQNMNSNIKTNNDESSTNLPIIYDVISNNKKAVGVNLDTTEQSKKLLKNSPSFKQAKLDWNYNKNDNIDSKQNHSTRDFKDVQNTHNANQINLSKLKSNNSTTNLENINSNKTNVINLISNISIKLFKQTDIDARNKSTINTEHSAKILQNISYSNNSSKVNTSSNKFIYNEHLTYLNVSTGINEKANIDRNSLNSSETMNSFRKTVYGNRDNVKNFSDNKSITRDHLTSFNKDYSKTMNVTRNCVGCQASADNHDNGTGLHVNQQDNVNISHTDNEKEIILVDVPYEPTAIPVIEATTLSPKSSLPPLSDEQSVESGEDDINWAPVRNYSIKMVELTKRSVLLKKLIYRSGFD